MKHILVDLLQKISSKNEENNHIVDNAAFKRGMYNGSVEAFFFNLKPYYQKKKQQYLERKPTYNNFVTVLRQVCNNEGIQYTSQIKYDKSNYDIIYLIKSGVLE